MLRRLAFYCVCRDQTAIASIGASTSTNLFTAYAEIKQEYADWDMYAKSYLFTAYAEIKQIRNYFAKPTPKLFTAYAEIKLLFPANVVTR